jgi:UTP--glucose-1-phosphate uridylyltransferase
MSESTLRQELAALDADSKKHLQSAGFDPEMLIRVAATLGADPGERDRRNRVSGEVKAPADDELLSMPARFSPEHERLKKIGAEALGRGELAFCVLAGGMATRMGGVVKALVDALPPDPTAGGAEQPRRHTFLNMRLAENAAASKLSGRPVPLWLMTSDATDGAIRDALKAANAPAHVRAFMQNLSVRLTPDGHVFKTKDGKPSLHATGHGDLPDAMRRAGLVKEFLAAGGKYVWMANLDNLGASIDPAILGRFIESKKDVMVEVCEKAAGDKGGIPVHALGHLQVLEEFRLPKTFDPTTVRYFNTNTFLVRADSLQNATINWTYFEVEKKVEGATAIQYERLLQELTSALAATYVKVPREGAESRFLPVKDHDELAKRQGTIREVAEGRGML